MSNKKILVIILLLVLLLVFLIFLVFRKADQESTTPIPLTNNIPESIQIDSENLITINIDESKLDLPKSASLLAISPQSPIPQEKIDAISGNFDFTGDPLMVNDKSLGSIHVFNGDSYSMSITPSSNSTSYNRNLSTSSTNKQLTDNDLEAIGTDFLVNKLEITGDKIEFIGFSYFNTSVEGEQIISTTKSNADIYQLNYSPVVNDLIILTLNPDLTPYYVQILPDGNVQKAAVQEIGNLSETGEKLNLKNLTEITNSLNEARIISLDQGNMYLTSLDSQNIGSIKIDEIKLAYLFISNQDQVLRPIYIMKGKAVIHGPDVSSEVEVVLYMPALASPAL